jgi:hypothetical protein
MTVQHDTIQYVPFNHEDEIAAIRELVATPDRGPEA